MTTTTTRTGWARIRAYCTCGARLDAMSEPPDAAEFAHRTFTDLHTGDGHKPCNAATARRARRAALRTMEGART